MDEITYDYLEEYIAHMLPEARGRLMGLAVYRAYRSEKRRLCAAAAELSAQGRPLSDGGLLADVCRLEALGDRVLAQAKRLDPYGDGGSCSPR